MSTLFILVGVLGLYFLPTLIAALRGRRNGWAIFAVNGLLGWTIAGWIWALIWSLTADTVAIEIYRG